MSLTLSRSELARLERAQQLLLSRLDHPAAAEWHGAVSEALRALVGADHASLFESGPRPALHYSTLDDGVLREYLTQHVGRDPVTRAVVERDVECGCTWDVISPQAFARTDFYHEYVRPHALYDAAGYSVRRGGDARVWLTFQHARPRAAGALRRSAALLRLALPAFRAGVRLEPRLAAWREDAFHSLDVVGDGVLLCDAAGRARHANPALHGAIAHDPEGARLWAAAVALARRFARRGRGQPLPLATRALRTAAATYDLTAVAAGGELLPDGVLVILRPRGQPDALLRARFGLTAREVEVARQLAAGRSNAELAAALGISPYTARRHTERVLRKLGVATRAQVGARLLA